ncbi:retrovirus-related pol polyprotein from [Plakobranchus ocellatus]|uniref:Retrovirus-related pol polyprotein from n=1 Tax=Plakobranchus ocellatus TaxID=259542 RepID=A0AAV4C0T7_9GAST|nr:retrovirus-related pol polyprotein from [Plakobranchus ocellatus]
MIRDRIVIGIVNDKTKEKLLEVKDLDLQKCLDICRAGETAQSQIKEMHNSGVHKISTKSKNQKTYKPGSSSKASGSKSSNPCQRCGRHHKINECPAFREKCRRYQKVGHFQKMCRKKEGKHGRFLNQDESEEDEYPVMIGTLDDQRKKKTDWNVNILVNGTAISFKIDTGAAVTVIPMSLVQTKQRLKKQAKNSSAQTMMN